MNRLDTNLTNGIIKIELKSQQEFIQDVCIGYQKINKSGEHFLVREGCISTGNFLFFVSIGALSKSPDPGTDQLIKGEASYLLASSASKHKQGISSLVRAVVETLSKCRGHF